MRELGRALNYIQVLDSKLTDERGIFVPFKVIELSVKAAFRDGMPHSLLPLPSPLHPFLLSPFPPFSFSFSPSAFSSSSPPFSVTYSV